MPKIVTRIEEIAAKRPGHVAIASADGDLSYQDLLLNARDLAERLRTYVPPGAVVAIHQQHGVGYLTSLLAILMADCIYLPLDGSEPPERLRELALEVGVTTCLTDTPVALERLPRAGFVTLKRRLVLASFAASESGGNKGRGYREPNSLQSTPVGDLANIVFTSGSSGRAEAIARSQRAILKHVEAWSGLLSEEERRHLLSACSPAFSMSQTAMFLAWLTGATLVAPPSGWQQNLRLLAACVRRYRVTAFKTIPSCLEKLGQLLGAGQALPFAPTAIVSGEQAEWAHLHAWRQAVPGSRVINAYGLTQAYSAACFHVPAGDRTPATGSVPIGRAVDGNEITELDGRLYVRGDCLAAGVVRGNRLELLDFVEVEGVAWLPTSDEGRADRNGILHVSGRLDHKFNHRGYDLGPTKIEEAIRLHPDVDSAAVAYDSRQSRIVALLVPAPGRQIDADGLRTFARGELSAMMVPQSFRIVRDLPRLISGKIDRKSLDPAAGTEAQGSAPTGPPAGSDLEREISQAVLQKLGREPAGIDQPWHYLGGDSLGLQDLLLDLETRFSVLLEAGFEQATVRELARAVRRAQSAKAPPVRGAGIVYSGVWEVHEPTELSDPASLWRTLSLVEAHAEPYTVSQRLRLKKPEKWQTDQTSVRLEFEGGADPETLGRSLAALIADHDGLRRALSATPEEQLTYSPAGELLLPTLDARGLPSRDVEDLVHALFGMALPPDRWPAMRWLLIRRTTKDVFLWQLSHTLVDLASTDVLGRQLVALCEQGGPGGSEDTPPVQNGTARWHAEMEALSYSEEDLTWVRDTLYRYQQLVPYARARLLGSRIERPGKRAHRYSRDGNYEQEIVDNAFAYHADAPTILAPYVLAVARWLRLSAVPLRVGSSARDYQAFGRAYRRTVGQFNDHFLLPIETPSGSTLVDVEGQLRALFERIRQRSINFDKSIELLQSRGDDRLDTLGNFVGAAPLGKLTTGASSNGSIRAVPRPLWGRWSFGPKSRGTKIGLYSFEGERGTNLLLFARGVWSRAFELLCEELRSRLPSRT